MPNEVSRRLNPRAPGLTEPAIRRALARISSMKFFPSKDDDLKAIIAEDLVNICATDEQADRLSKHFKVVYPEWPGAYELRACACSMFRPVDGVEVDSAVYPEGVPTATELASPELAAIPGAERRLDLKPAAQLAAHKQLREQAAPYVEDPELNRLMDELRAKNIPPVRTARTVEEIHAELYKSKTGEVSATHEKPKEEQQTTTETT